MLFLITELYKAVYPHALRLPVCSNLSYLLAMIIIIFFAFLLPATSHLNGKQFEETHEKLSISYLNDRDILTSFNFSIYGSVLNGDEAQLFYVPWLIRKLFDEHAIEHLELSLTQGFWRSNIWGTHPATDVSSGTALLVKFNSTQNESIDLRWSNFLHQLNGIFCTSMLNMNPELTSIPKLFVNDYTGNSWRFGVLSSESVCSENLKPWKKLLPCKQHGLVSLLKPRNLLSSDFHSISLLIRRKLTERFIFWDLNLLANTVHSERKYKKKYWSLQSLFGQKLSTKCRIFDSSTVLLEKVPHWTLNKTSNDRLIDKKYYQMFDLSLWNEDDEFKLTVPISSSIQKNLQNQFLSTNQAFGIITSKISNYQLTDVNVIFSHMIPWQLRVYLHTLRVLCTRQSAKNLFEIVPKQKIFSLAKDYQRPLYIELAFNLPTQAICKISVDYEAAFLKITSFPADANNGLFVPGSILTVLTDKNFTDWSKSFNNYLRLHGEPLLILLPVPDFSMPFNVICLVCTSIAIFYGNVITITTKLMKPVIKKNLDDELINSKSSSLRCKTTLIRGWLTYLWKALVSNFKKRVTKLKDS